MPAWTFMTKGARDDAVAKACDRGEHLLDFAQSYGCSATAALAIADRLGISFRPRPILTAPIEDATPGEPGPSLVDVEKLREDVGIAHARIVASAATIASLTLQIDALRKECSRWEAVHADTKTELATMAEARRTVAEANGRLTDDLANVRDELALRDRDLAECRAALSLEDPVPGEEVTVREFVGGSELVALIGDKSVGTDVLDYLEPADVERLKAMAEHSQESIGLVGAKLLAAVLIDDAVANGEVEAPDAPLSPPAAADVVAALSPLAREALLRQAQKEETLPTNLVVLVVETVCRDNLWDAVIG